MIFVIIIHNISKKMNTPIVQSHIAADASFVPNYTDGFSWYMFDFLDHMLDVEWVHYIFVACAVFVFFFISQSIAVTLDVMDAINLVHKTPKAT